MESAPLTPEFLFSLGRKELQCLAKSKGVRANTTNQQMVHDILKVATAGGSRKGTAIQREDEDLPRHQDQGASKGPHGSATGTSSITANTMSSGISSTLAALKLKSRVFAQPDFSQSQTAAGTSRQESGQHLPAVSSFKAAPALDNSTAGVPSAAHLQGMESCMQWLHSMVDSKPTGKGTAGKAYCGIMLAGPPGNGKKSLAQTLAHDLVARHHVLDLASVIGSAAEAQHAGDAVRAQCQMISKRSGPGPHMLVIDHLEALAVTDHTKARACFRAKAELMVGLCQIKQSAHACSSSNSSAPGAGSSQTSSCSRPAVIVVGIFQGEGAVDPALQGGILESDPAAAAAGHAADAPVVLHVPVPDHQRRESILYHMMCTADAELNAIEMDVIARECTVGMSVKEVLALCKAAEQQAAIRAKNHHLADPHINMTDVEKAWLACASHA